MVRKDTIALPHKSEEEYMKFAIVRHLLLWQAVSIMYPYGAKLFGIANPKH